VINLLPPDIKQNLVYARRNTEVRRWAIIFIISIAGVWIIVLGGLFYMQRTIHSYTDQRSKNQSVLNAQHMDQTQKQVSEISSSLELAVKVLSREVLFSNLIKQIGAVIPPNASLTNLSITQTQGGIDLTAVATDYNTATQVQVNLQDPANKIFDKADILSISCSGTNSANPRYPCSVSIRAQFVKNNPFLFINTGGKGGS
jgi:Tfp pilus assembly protein PilN